MRRQLRPRPKVRGEGKPPPPLWTRSGHDVGTPECHRGEARDSATVVGITRDLSKRSVCLDAEAGAREPKQQNILKFGAEHPV